MAKWSAGYHNTFPFYFQRQKNLGSAPLSGKSARRPIQEKLALSLLRVTPLKSCHCTERPSQPTGRSQTPPSTLSCQPTLAAASDNPTTAGLQFSVTEPCLTSFQSHGHSSPTQKAQLELRSCTKGTVSCCHVHLSGLSGF